MFRIRDVNFQVEEAKLFFEIRHLEEAQLVWGPANKGIGWFIDVRARDIDASVDVQFRANPANALFKWAELEGASFTIKDFSNRRPKVITELFSYTNTAISMNVTFHSALVMENISTFGGEVYVTETDMKRTLR